MKWEPRGDVRQEGASLYVGGKYRGGVWRSSSGFGRFYWIAYGKTGNEDKSGWTLTLEKGKDNVVEALVAAVLEAA